MLKLYKKEILQLGDEEIEVRAYRVVDTPLVADLLKIQIEIEDNEKNKETKIPIKFVEQKKMMEEKAHILSQRMLHRAYTDNIDFHTPVEEIDQLEPYEVDPDYELQIAWTMIRLGTPTIGGIDKKKQKKKKSSVKKDG